MQTSKSIILQVGESTHTHVLESKQDIQHETVGDAIHFLLKDTGVVRHEEHGRIVLDKGNYFKFPQMEYDPMLQETRYVFD